MNAASLELCKELYELSGWGDSDLVFFEALKFTSKPSVWEPVQREQDDMGVTIPAYDLGYLLRKLPRRFTVDGVEYILRMPNPFDTDWRFDYWNEATRSRPFDKGNGDNLIVVADTPEDAACKLAIELFKQGILKT